MVEYCRWPHSCLHHHAPFDSEKKIKTRRCLFLIWRGGTLLTASSWYSGGVSTLCALSWVIVLFLYWISLAKMRLLVNCYDIEKVSTTL